MGDVLASPAFLVSYAVIQTVALLLLARLLDLYEHHPVGALAVLAVWGAVGATALAALGTPPVQALLPPDTRLVFGPALSAPLVEELAKGVPVAAALGLAAWAHARFGTPSVRGVTPGLVYGAAAGLGFAFTEDLHYFVTTAAREGLERGVDEFVTRRDFLGTGVLQHAMFTGVLGASLGLALWSRRRSIRIGVPALGLLGAVALHAVNNGFVEWMIVARHGTHAAVQFLASGDGLDTAVVVGRAGSTGADTAVAGTYDTAVRLVALVQYLTLVAFAGSVAAWQAHQRRIIRRELAPEVEGGLVDIRDVELVAQFWKRAAWYWALCRVGELQRARALRRYHVEVANLAFLRWATSWGRVSGDELWAARDRVANLRGATTIDLRAHAGAQ